MIPDHPPYLDQNPRHRVDILATVLVLARELGLNPESRIIDVGCNTGDWLRGFLERGFTHVMGIDQESMRPHLLIPEKHFIAADLRYWSYPYNVADLVLCMEVGEHMEARHADFLIDACINLSPNGAVVFSAATPGQGGHGHVNEQPAEYWAEKFAARGWIWDDSIRAKLPEDLVWWYRRNMVICKRETAVPR